MENYVKWASSRCHNWKSPRCRRIRRLDICRELDLDRSRFNDLVLKCNHYIWPRVQLLMNLTALRGGDSLLRESTSEKCRILSAPPNTPAPRISGQPLSVLSRPAPDTP